MRVTRNKTKKGTSYYIIRSLAGGSTEVVEKLGYEDEIKKKYHCEDAYAWAKKRASELTIAEQESQNKIMVPFRPNMQINKDKQLSYDIGYLFLQQIYYELGIPSICKEITKRHHYEYDLNEILSRLVYGRILFPDSKLATYKQSQSFFEKPTFEYHDVMRALSVIAEEFGFIQSQLYKRSDKVIPRNTGVLYYDCTNFFFEIEQEKGIRKYGKSKENRPNPIVQMGLLMDYSGLPLAITITDGNMNEQTTLQPLEAEILKDFELSKFVICTDAGLSSESNRKFNNFGERSFVTTQSIKKMKKDIQEWCLEPQGWHLSGSNDIFNLTEIQDTEEHQRENFEKIFYKECCIEGYDEERDIEFNQTLMVTFSLKYKNYLESVRNAQLERAQKLIHAGNERIERKGQHDIRRFISRTFTDKAGNTDVKTTYSINEEAVQEEAKFDGFYAMTTNLDDDVETILQVTKGRWEIEESFRIMKSDFDARPVYLQRDERIKAHFMTCFISLLIYRILEKKIGGTFTCSQILSTLRSMKVTSVSDVGYIPAYTRTDLTDVLHETAGFHTDFEILRKRTMQGIIRRSKGL